MPHNEIDVAVIATNPWLRTVVHERVVASTNSFVAQLVAAGSCDLPLLMLADEQTAGRGRGANRWWSFPGSITLSLAIRRSELTIAPQSIYSLAVAVALQKALSTNVDPSRLALKWPNDVLLDERKVAGILLETAGPLASVLVVGIGINANNDFRAAPPEVRQGATSIGSATGGRIEITPLIVSLISSLQAAFSNRTTTGEVLTEYRRADYLSGRRVRIGQGDQQFTGTCMEIDDNGAIVVQTETGSVALASGSVELCDPN